MYAFCAEMRAAQATSLLPFAVPEDSILASKVQRYLAAIHGKPTVHAQHIPLLAAGISGREQRHVVRTRRTPTSSASMLAASSSASAVCATFWRFFAFHPNEVPELFAPPAIALALSIFLVSDCRELD